MNLQKLPEYRTVVSQDWIDYNGHMSEAFYVLIFGFATDAVMDVIGLDKAAREDTGCSLYTVEAHIRYLHEVHVDAPVTVQTLVVGAGAKKLHLAHQMYVEGRLVATEEIMCLHVSGEQAAVTPFASEVVKAIARFGPISESAAPEWAGRRIG